MKQEWPQFPSSRPALKGVLSVKKLTLLLALLVLVLSAPSALAEQDNLGNPMPDFSFVNTEGETIPLSEVL